MNLQRGIIERQQAQCCRIKYISAGAAVSSSAVAINNMALALEGICNVA